MLSNESTTAYLQIVSTMDSFRTLKIRFLLLVRVTFALCDVPGFNEEACHEAWTAYVRAFSCCNITSAWSSCTARARSSEVKRSKHKSTVLHSNCGGGVLG